MTDDLQDQIERGRKAEQFLNYVTEHGYFPELIERVRLEYAHRILELRPDQAAEFTRMKERVDVWTSEIMEAVGGDIAVARVALKKLEGEPEKGLL